MYQRLKQNGKQLVFVQQQWSLASVTKDLNNYESLRNNFEMWNRDVIIQRKCYIRRFKEAALSKLSLLFDCINDVHIFALPIFYGLFGAVFE